MHDERLFLITSSTGLLFFFVLSYFPPHHRLGYFYRVYLLYGWYCSLGLIDSHYTITTTTNY